MMVHESVRSSRWAGVRGALVLGVGVGLLAGVVLAGCGDDDDASDVVDANAQFCADLGGYGTAIGALAALDPATASKADYDSAADEVRSSREAMIESAGDLSEAEWVNLQTQVDELGGQLRDAPDDQAVQSVLAEAQAQAVAVRASVATVNTAVCTAGAATTSSS